jgi:hypothetical protein
MKRILALVLLFAPVVGFTQIWYVGAKGGVTFSNYKSETPWKEATNTGYSFGASAYKQVGKNTGFGIELQYVQKGYYHKVCNTITDQLKANYIEIPFMADYAFIIPGLQNFKAHVNLGAYTAYWVSAKYKLRGFDSSSEEFDFKKNDAKRFDFGPLAGGRIEYIFRNSSLSLDFRYELGVLDLQKNIQNPAANTNRAFLVGLNYMKVLNY